MIVLGLTGSIGMGKSTIAAMFADEGIAVFDADQAVHRLYQPGGAAVEPIRALFGNVVSDGAIDRKKLAASVLGDTTALKAVEDIVHPLVRAGRQRFLDQARLSGEAIVVIDIPLLFETGGDDAVDKVVVVTAPENMQRQRVLERPGMTVEKYERILAKQMPDAEKRKRADFVIDTSHGLEPARQQVREIIDALTARVAHQ